VADDLRRLAEAHEKAKAEYMRCVAEAIPMGTEPRASVSRRLDACEHALIRHVTSGGILTLYARLDDAEARNRRSFCGWCSQEQDHADLATRRDEIIAHTVGCPERPEPRLLDALAAAERKLDALEAAARAFASGEGWGRRLAWMVEGAPTREEGITEAKAIVAAQVALEQALARALEGQP